MRVEISKDALRVDDARIPIEDLVAYSLWPRWTGPAWLKSIAPLLRSKRFRLRLRVARRTQDGIDWLTLADEPNPTFPFRPEHMQTSQLVRALTDAGVPRCQYPFRATEVDDNPAYGTTLSSKDQATLRSIGRRALVVDDRKGELVEPDFERIGQAGPFGLYRERKGRF
jgi:hypothetical protein